MTKVLVGIVMFVGLVLCTHNVYAETWTATAYCSCVKCCGKNDSITASGVKTHWGTVANNWLKFGTKLSIKGMGVFTVEDRGAKSQFGSKTNHKKRLDIWFPTHEMARKFGRKQVDVTII